MAFWSIRRNRKCSLEEREKRDGPDHWLVIALKEKGCTDPTCPRHGCIPSWNNYNNDYSVLWYGIVIFFLFLILFSTNDWHFQ